MKGTTSSRNHGGRLEGKRCTRLREQQRGRPQGRTGIRVHKGQH